MRRNLWQGRGVRKPWQGWLAALTATLVAAGLVVADLTDSGMRHWWTGHALTTDTVSGLLVLLVTVLVVDQVVRRRQVRDRSRAVAAQAAIVVGQAVRSDRALAAALDGSGDRDAASDEVRTYMMMLLVSAPVLIDARVSREFLEQAQRLAGEMARALSATARAPGSSAASAARLGSAVDALRAASAPLLRPLDLDELIAAGANGTSSPDAATGPPAGSAGSVGPGGSPPDDPRDSAPAD
jgi:hypothetical protein